MDFQEALSAVCGRLARLGDGVHVLAPPGSGRRGLARCLAGRGLKVFAPRGYGVEAVEEYGGVEDLARRLEGAEGLVFVVVGSSREAVELARLAGGTSLSGRLGLVYLPALYGELLVEGRRRRLAWVSHDRLCAAYEGRVVGGACEGPAPGLLSSSPEELEAGVEALRALRRSHMAENLGEAALRLLLDVAGIVGPLGGVAAAVKAVYDFFQAVTRQRYGEVAGLLKFIEAAERARVYVRRPEFEALVDSVALEWGMETGRFKTLVEALGDPSLVDWLAHGRHVESLGRFGKVYARYNAEGLGVTDEYVIEAGVRYPLARGVFVEKAGEVMRLLGNNKAAALVGPRGVGKSTLAKYVAYRILVEGQVDYVVVAEGPVNANELLKTVASLRGRVLLLFDVHPREVYTPRFLLGAAEGAEKPLEAAARAINSLLAAAGLDPMGRLRVLVTASDDELKTLGVALDSAAVYRVDLSDVEFLAEVVRSYVGEHAESCQEVERLARIIKEHYPDGAYTLVAKYAGLWLRDNGCKVESVERAVEEAKREPKLFLAHYIWHVLLKGRGDLARKAAVPLLLHAYFGPVPVGVTYVTKAVKNGVWRFLKPEELEGVGLESLKEDELEPIARWLAQRHEDLVEETLRDLAGLNGEETRKPYREALTDLIKALDWARDEAIKEGDKALAELGIPEKGMRSETALLVFVVRRLAAVFKSGESKRCWKRAAFIVGHALVIFPKVSRREQLSEDSVEVLGDILEPCAVDNYLMIDGKMTPLSIYVARLTPIREFNILSPFADEETVEEAKKTVEKLLGKWRRKGFTPPEVFYALGLAVLAAEGDVDEGTADMLLYAASAAVQLAAHPTAVLPVLARLRPLGVKAPHRYVATLAATSELTTLDQGTVWYIYFTLQQLENRLLRSERIWPLVYAVNAYSNLLIKHLVYIKDYWGNAAADMCQLYSEVKRRCATATADGNLSTQRLLAVAATARVLAVALYSDALAQLVQALCGLDDLEREAEAVRNTLEEAAARPNELRKIMESDADFAEWVTTQIATGDAGMAIEELMAWFVQMPARYKLNHAINKEGELDEKRLEETTNMFKKIAEMYTRPEQRGDYFIINSWALRAHILAAKSWVELLDRAKGYWELWKEAEKSRIPTARYLEAAAHTLGECLVYLVASGKKEEASRLLKEYRVLLDYVPEVSVATRLMLKLLGVGEGAKLEEIIQAFEPTPLPKYLPAILMLVGRLQREGALEECAKLPEAEECVIAVAAAAGNQEAVERLKSEIEREVPEAHPLLEVADGKTLVEILVPKDSMARLAFMLLTAVEGRADAVRLHGLRDSAGFMEPLPRRLFHAVYESCSDLNSEGCRTALLKLYYLHL